MSDDAVREQRKAMDDHYSDHRSSRWSFHYTKDPLVRYLRDRRLLRAMRMLRAGGLGDVSSLSVLVACGGVGGEGTFLANQGFLDVTVSDLSEEALETCRQLDPRLKTLPLNAEDMKLPDSCYDIVLVQDGLHHLPRPALGLTEMLRVSRRAAVVIEPHFGLAGRLMGTTWERHGQAINFVFRWSRQSFEQVVRSYLLSEDSPVVVDRFWDHNLKIDQLVAVCPHRTRLQAARAVYGWLRLFDRVGNMFVGVAFKPKQPPPPRLLGH